MAANGLWWGVVWYGLFRILTRHHCRRRRGRPSGPEQGGLGERGETAVREARIRTGPDAYRKGSRRVPNGSESVPRAGVWRSGFDRIGEVLGICKSGVYDQV